MGWSGANNSKKPPSFSFKSLKVCSLRTVLGCSSDDSRKKFSDSDDRCLSQSLCPLLYNVCGSSDGEGISKNSTDVEKKTIKGENVEPPEYYQQVTHTTHFMLNS